MFLAALASAALLPKAAYSLPARPSPLQSATSAQRKSLASESASPHEPFVPWNMYWDGIDVFDGEDKEENTKLFGTWEQPSRFFAARRGHTGGPRVGVQVIGLQDTGTNLLSQLLYRNFGGQVAHYDSSAEGDLAGVWKHASMKWLDTKVSGAFDNLKNHSVVPLVMIRSPLSWLQSIKKAPYELSGCVTGDDWLERPCVHPTPAGYVNGSDGKPVGPAIFGHLLGVWGRWVESYRPYLEKNFPEVIIVRYEDLVLHTQDVLKQIARGLNLELPEEIDIIDAPAKDHGAAVGHVVAVQKIKNTEYLAEYSSEELRLVCNQIALFNTTVVEFAYHDCLKMAGAAEDVADWAGDIDVGDVAGDVGDFVGDTAGDVGDWLEDTA